MELMIGMIISSIVAVICYSAYSYTIRQYYVYKEEKSKVNEIMGLRMALLSDISAAGTVSCNNKKITIKSDSATIVYVFGDSSITRTINEHTDTFNLNVLQLNSSVISSNPLQDTLISSLSFRAKTKTDTCTFQFNKQYSAATLIKQKGNRYGN